MGRGDHEIWTTADGRPFTVPRTLKGEGTLRHILKYAEVPTAREEPDAHAAPKKPKTAD